MMDVLLLLIARVSTIANPIKVTVFLLCELVVLGLVLSPFLFKEERVLESEPDNPPTMR